MEVPEKIYLNPLLTEDGESIVRRCTFERQRNSQIEYIRTDVFIEQALKFLDGCIPDYIDLKQAKVDNKRFIEDFKNHIKGK